MSQRLACHLLNDKRTNEPIRDGSFLAASRKLYWGPVEAGPSDPPKATKLRALGPGCRFVGDRVGTVGDRPDLDRETSGFLLRRKPCTRFGERSPGSPQTSGLCSFSIPFKSPNFM